VIKPRVRLHRECRFCRCSPGEYGEEVCRNCGDLFIKKTAEQVVCSAECRKIEQMLKYEKSVREKVEAEGGEWTPWVWTPVERWKL